MLKKLLILSWLFITMSSPTQAQTELFHRARIYYESPENIKRLQELGVPMDHGIRKENTYIECDYSEEELKHAKELGLRTEIIIENVGKFYLDQNNPKSQHYVPKPISTKNANCSGNSGTPTYTTPTNYHNGSMGGFLTYSEILQELDEMYTYAQNNGIDIITQKASINNASNPTDLQTAGGRYLQWVKISDNPNTDETTESEILYTSLHHAREPASMQQLIFYMWYLLENYNSDAEIKALVDNTELYFIPCVNPDGYLHNESTNPNGSGFWRKNRRDHGGGVYGVDNNRNYSFIDGGGNEVWNTSGTSPNQWGDAYAGTGPFSEPENRAVRYFVENHEFTIALNNHTYGELLLYPHGYANIQTADNSLFQSISGMMVAQNGYNNQLSALLYPAAGDSDDFMYGMLTTTGGGARSKVFAMTPEIGSSFWPAANSIEGICKEMMFHNITAAHLVDNYAVLTDTSPDFITNTTTNITYSLQRLGIKDPGNFTVSINPVSANILSVGSANSHNGLTLQQTVNGSISLNLSPTINTGDSVQFELIVNNGSYNNTLLLTKTFGQSTLLVDEPGDNVSQWTQNGWGTTTATFVSSPTSITDSPGSDYSNNQNKTIELTNSIDLSTAINANLTFYARWDIENNFDYAQIQVSTDNGATWIPQCGQYTNLGTNNQSGATNEPVYDDSQTSWVQENISLSDYLGSTIKIRFQLVTDGGNTRDGFYFDDLKVNVVDQALSTDDFIQNNFSMYPNPVTNQLTISSQLNDYNYAIYTIHGQRLATVKKLNQSSQIDFSNYDTGMYFIDIELEGKKSTFKIIKQ